MIDASCRCQAHGATKLGPGMLETRVLLLILLISRFSWFSVDAPLSSRTQKWEGMGRAPSRFI